ncbi:hypothetical protein F4804DRAFT_327811 [Jackrogersella minutella]|nr:hypothetical protein F4804DRAFT_327811 [Jackrogersella minutella]
MFTLEGVRAFTSIIVNSDLNPLLSTALVLLKPGGSLQWEESRADRYFVQSPSPEISTSACDTVVHLLKAAGEARGSIFDFLGDLGSHLKQHGFENVHA